jgi:UDP:flavonoid glycosyltransferase YjiC (YdhE family)
MATTPRILLAWELGGALGHITKFIVLAERLQALGFEIWVASQNLVSAEAVLGRLGVRLVQAPVWLARPGNIPEPINYAGILARKGWLSAEGLTSLARGWRDLVEAIAPRLIVANHAPGLLLGMRGHDIPLVFADTSFGIPPPTQPFQNMRYWQTDTDLHLMREIEAQVLNAANKALDTLRQPPMRQLCDLFQNVDTCLMSLPELDHYPDRGSADYLGPIYARSWGESPVWPAGDSTRVFVYLDSVHPLFEPLLNHLTRLSCQILVYSAGPVPATLAKHSNIKFCKRPQHIAEVLASAAWVIHHAGFGLASQALLDGVPLLMLPNHLEQRLCAMRVSALKAGRVLPNDAGRLDSALQQAMQDKQYSEHARAFAERHRDYRLETTQTRLIDHCLARIDSAGSFDTSISKGP